MSSSRVTQQNANGSLYDSPVSRLQQDASCLQALGRGLQQQHTRNGQVLSLLPELTVQGTQQIGERRCNDHALKALSTATQHLQCTSCDSDSSWSWVECVFFS